MQKPHPSVHRSSGCLESWLENTTAKKPTKATIEELLKDIDMTSDKLTENETKKLEELDKILLENPDLKNMSMDDLIGMLNLSEDDKKQLQKQVNDIMTSGNIDLKNQDLSKAFPAMDSEMQGIMDKMEAEFASTPGLREEFQSWMSGIQEKLGPNLEKIESMTEEEVNKLSLPPPRLRAVMDRLIPDTDKFNTLNLDRGMNLGPEGKIEFATEPTKDEDGEPIEVKEIKFRK